MSRQPGQEALLVGAVLAPVLLSRRLRRSWRDMGGTQRTAVGLMVAAQVVGQMGGGTATFPFVRWDMYTRPASGDPVVYEYDAVLSDGTTVPLAPRRILGPQSAARLMEALRRQVDALRRHESEELRSRHARTVQAIAARRQRACLPARIERVVVQERTVALTSGRRGEPLLLWEVLVP